MSFLFVDRIVELIPGKSTRGIKHITADDSYLSLDKTGKPCFIASLIGETLGQLAAWNVMYTNDFRFRPVAGLVDRANLYRPAYVGESLFLESFIEGLDEDAVNYRCHAKVNEEIIFKIEGALGPLLPMAEFISEDEVRQQFEEIYRPDDFFPYEFNCSSPFPHLSLATDIPCKSLRFDRILANEPGVNLSAEKYITRAAGYFADHFPKKPVLPLTVLLECKLNLAQEFMARANLPQSYEVTELRKIKMKGFVYPGDRLICTVKIKEQTANQVILHYCSHVTDKRVCVLEIVMEAKSQ